MQELGEGMNSPAISVPKKSAGQRGQVADVALGGVGTGMIVFLAPHILTLRALHQMSARLRGQLPHHSTRTVTMQAVWSCDGVLDAGEAAAAFPGGVSVLAKHPALHGAAPWVHLRLAKPRLPLWRILNVTC